MKKLKLFGLLVMVLFLGSTIGNCAETYNPTDSIYLSKISLASPYVTPIWDNYALFGEKETGNKFRNSGKNEVRLTIGVVTINGLYDIVLSITSAIFTGGNFQRVRTAMSPAIGFIYQYEVAPHFFVGGEASYQFIKNKIYRDDNFKGIQNANFFTIAAEIEYHYISGDWFEMYSGLGIGYLGILYKDVSADPTVKPNNYLFSSVTGQLTAVGFRFGKAIAGTLELGYGYRGLINAGIVYRF